MKLQISAASTPYNALVATTIYTMELKEVRPLTCTYSVWRAWVDHVRWKQSSTYEMVKCETALSHESRVEALVVKGFDDLGCVVEEKHVARFRCDVMNIFHLGIMCTVHVL